MINWIYLESKAFVDQREVSESEALEGGCFVCDWVIIVSLGNFHNYGN